MRLGLIGLALAAALASGTAEAQTPPVGSPIGGGPAAEPVPGGHGIVERGVAEGHEGHDVHHADARVHPGVVAEIEPVQGLRRHGSGRRLTHQRQHAAVVVGIGVDVEQVWSGPIGDGRHRLQVHALADVHHALQHRCSIPDGTRARRGRAPTVCGPVGSGSVARMGPEWIVVLVVVLLLFGSSQLPKLARSLGQAQKEFKQGMDEGGKADGTDGTETKA